MSAQEKSKGGVLDKLKLKAMAAQAQAMAAPEVKVVLLPLDVIAPDPAQPRTTFHSLDGEVVPEEQEALEQLAANVAQHGLLQPITVRRINDDRYEIIAGERRWRAFKLNQARGVDGAERIPAFVREQTDATELRLLQLAENQQRRDLSDIEVATFLKNLLEENPELQKQDLARLMNKNSQYISRILAVIDPRWAHVVDTGIITYASVLEQFRALPEDKQSELVERAREEGRTITSQDVRAAKAPKLPPTAPLEGPGVTDVLAHDVEAIMASQAPPNESYQRDTQTPPASIEDHSGDTAPRDTEALSQALFDTQQVHLTLGQLAALLDHGALSPAEHSVTLTLPAKDIKQAIIALGGEVPANDQLLGLELVKRTNSL